MADLVEELKEWGKQPPLGHTYRAELCLKAAAEIERLRGGVVGADARAENDPLWKILEAVEDWWLSEGMAHFNGAPYAIFAVRAALNARANVGAGKSAVEKRLDTQDPARNCW